MFNLLSNETVDKIRSIEDDFVREIWDIIKRYSDKPVKVRFVPEFKSDEAGHCWLVMNVKIDNEYGTERAQ